MNQTALITGASGGIGYELAKLFAQDHCNLVLVARSGDKLAQVADELQRQFGMAVYYATKAYVISFSEALANELKDKGVSVTCLCPGATDTGFQGRAGTEQTVLFRKMRPMDAGTVARDGYRGLMAGKTLVISGLRNRLLAESIRLAPRKLVTAISRKILDKAG